MVAPIASDTRNPFNANSETRAWSRGDDSPAVTRIGTELVAVQMGDVGLVIDFRSPDVHRRGVLDHAFLFGVAVEADDRAQPARHRRSRLAAVLQVAGEALDVDRRTSNRRC